MSQDWNRDIAQMHEKFGFKEATHKLDQEKLLAYLKFRFKFLGEELNEGLKAIENQDAKEIVDALIDLIVVAAGTLDAYGVESYRAWDEVLFANLEKEVGIKASRPNPFGLPDLIKPPGWRAPNHSDNVGIIPRAFGK